MPVVLEILSGPRTGRRVRLSAGQEVCVGRTAWADVSVPEDGCMSRTHFILRFQGAGCFVQDLGSTNGTLVNGRLITDRVRLKEGDQVLAGQTRFKVHVETEARSLFTPPPPTAASTVVLEGAGVAPPSAPLDIPGESLLPGLRAGYIAEPCESGLILCRGMADDIHPAELAEQLARIWPLHFAVDFRKLDLAMPPELTSYSYLFDWLDPSSAPLVSPVFFSQADCPGWPDIVRQGWGNDGLVMLFSRQDRADLLRHMRHALRGKAKRDDHTAGMLGLCWPSVAALLLCHGPQRLVSQLMAGMEAVLVELPDLSETWQLIGSGRVTSALDHVGLVRQPWDATMF